MAETVLNEPDLANLGLGEPWSPTNNAIQADNTNVLPSVSPVPGLAGSTVNLGQVSQGSAAGGTGLNVGATSPTTAAAPAATSAPPSAAASTATPTSATGTGSVADYFARGVLIILGMIFVAIGLHMFAPGVVPDVRQVARQ
jgi:hypothetical protein